MLEVYIRPHADAWALLSDALALRGIHTLPKVERASQGKPFFPALPELHFNLSHTAGWSLCALSDAPVGVDIEALRPRREGLWRYCLTDGEYEAFLAAGGGWEEFYRLWTLKEAWCKYTGEGLGHPRLWPTPPPCPHRSYAGEGFAAAVCGEELPGPPLFL